MSAGGRIAFVGVGVLGVLIAAVVLWPAPAGPEPIVWGRDTCARCRMHLSQPGFSGQLRDADGVVRKFDDLGCLVGAIVETHAAIPEVWVEDHEGGGVVPLLSAHLVHAPGVATPMGHGVIAFSSPDAAEAFARASRGERVAFETLLRDGRFLARVAGRPAPMAEGSR
jgi:copper chaperone NosL